MGDGTVLSDGEIRSRGLVAVQRVCWGSYIGLVEDMETRHAYTRGRSCERAKPVSCAE